MKKKLKNSLLINNKLPVKNVLFYEYDFVFVFHSKKNLCLSFF